MVAGNTPDTAVANEAPRRAPASQVAALSLALLLVVVAVVRQTALGSAPTIAALRAAGGALEGPLDPPRAFLCHGAWVHLATNLVMVAVGAALWLSLSWRAARRRVHAAAGLVGLVALSGALSLGLAAAFDGGARVGASGAAHALLGALAVGLFQAGQLRAALAPLTLALLLAALPTPSSVDHLAHGLGFGLGAALHPLTARAPRTLFGLAAAWYLAAAAS